MARTPAPSEELFRREGARVLADGTVGLGGNSPCTSTRPGRGCGAEQKAVAVAAPEREDVREDVVRCLEEEPLVQGHFRQRLRAAALAEGRESVAEGEEFFARRIEP